MRGDVIGFRVSGVGQDTSKTDGTIFYKGPDFFDPSNYSQLSNYNWIRALINLPRGDEVENNPGKAEMSLPAYTPKVAMTQQVSKILRARQRKPPYELNSGIGGNLSDNSIQLASGATPFSVGDDIYIGDETMRITADNGGGAYNVDRAIWDSNVISHGSGAGIYTRPPFYRWRKVTFFRFPADEVLRTKWIGWLNERTPQEHSLALQLKCESPEAVPKDVVGFRNNPILDPVGSFPLIDGLKFRGPTANGTKDLTPSNIRSKVAKKKDASGNTQDQWNQKDRYATKPSQGRGGTSENGTASDVMWGCWRPETGGDFDAKPRIMPIVRNIDNLDGPRGGPPTDPTYDRYPQGDFLDNGADRWPKQNLPKQGGRGGFNRTPYRKTIKSSKVNEIALWKRSFGKAPYPISDAKQVFDNPWHPVAIAGAILCSGDHDQIRPQELDFVNGNIGLDMGWIIDQQSFIDLVNSEGSNSISIDQLILGWKGETEELFNIVLHLLASHGYFLAPQDDGTVGVAKWGRGTARDLSSATKVTPVFSDQDEDTWEWYPDGTDGQFVVSGEVGKTPLHESYKIEFFGLDATNRMQRRTDPDGTSYDHRFHKDNNQGRQKARQLLKRQTEYLFANMPSVKFKAPGDPQRDSGKDYSSGNFVIIEQPPEAQPDLGVDRGGAFEDMNSTARDDKYLGQIIARGWNPQDNSYTLEALLTNYDRAVGRDRAPAVQVKNYDYGAGSLVLRTYKNSFTGSLTQTGGTPDAQLFKDHVGAELKLLDGSMEPIDDTSLVKVDKVGSSSNSLDLDEMKLDTSFSTDPTEGDIITIANYDIFTFTLSGGFRQFAFWGDSNNELGGNNDDGDLYV